ncbi:hypothetical protein MNBD_PLANCTO02-1801 [hydrothermal vent metagenome]|uniref:Carboxypeptidase regulatory-like domain-containing protein n=1 Tax=hydrothermal vent metagenome TaxID=652676 RepID=A0A3B1DV32_9ZZZZ
MKSSLLHTLLFCCATLFITGCGGGAEKGPERFDVSGTVTFEGKPVYRGTIIFSPDATKGNSGPQGAAEITEGKYNTSKKGKGIVGGAHIITIKGSDKIDKNAILKKSDDGMEISPEPPFPAYTIKKDLPKEKSILDIDVPSKKK